MRQYTSYSVKIKHYNHILRDTLDVYRNAVDFYISVCLAEWDVIDKIGFNGEMLIGILKGIIELTNGAKAISLLGTTVINVCVLAFLIGFGGLSVLFQVYSIISKENISIKPYIYGKLLQGVLAFFYTLIFLNLF